MIADTSNQKLRNENALTEGAGEPLLRTDIIQQRLDLLSLSRLMPSDKTGDFLLGNRDSNPRTCDDDDFPVEV